MHKLLITGGAGFIGANFVQYWLGEYPQDRVVVLDALTYAGNRASLSAAESNPRFRFVHGDIRDQAMVEGLLEKESIDLLVHFAAESHVDRSILGPDAFIDTNVLGTHSLLKAAKKAWLDAPDASRRAHHRFHHCSTDEVYGTLAPNDPPFRETTAYAPNSPYAASKAASDHLVRAYHHTYGLQVTTSNCSNNYGPYQFPEKLIPLMLINALQGKPLPVYGDGLNVRDWLYVEDHCRGIAQVLEHGRMGETYNLGGQCEKTNMEVVRMLCALLDEAAPSRAPHCDLITLIKDRPGHDRRYAIDAGKAASEFDYRPAESFESGLRKTLAWYMANETWWQALLDAGYKGWIKAQYAPKVKDAEAPRLL
ncbi:MAG: dTDP-glucose 4,6-dehydratase [Gammaproteobacteria bacterium]|nr:dTDP-glucose 4,6-dehydratase [Gammaproteobacteria bacterium]